MKEFTLVLTLDKHGSVLHEMPCLPRATLPVSDIVAGLCAAPDASLLRRRAALWLLTDAKQRRKRGVTGYAVVAVQLQPGAERVFYADYCFKQPRTGLTSGSTHGLSWDALLRTLMLAAPTRKRTTRNKKRA